MSVIDTLLQRNARFAAERFNPDWKILPTLRTLIIACVDPRVDPAEVLGLESDEAAVIRNVGGRVFPSTIQTLGMLGQVTRANGGDVADGWNLIVLQHTDCGINCLVHSPGVLAQHFGLAADELESRAVANPYRAVAVDVAALKANPHLPGGFLVTGLVYDVKTGRVEVAVPTAPLRAAA